MLHASDYTYEHISQETIIREGYTSRLDTIVYGIAYLWTTYFPDDSLSSVIIFVQENIRNRVWPAVVVGLDQESVIGFGTLTNDVWGSNRDLWLGTAVVHESYRNQGIYTVLVRERIAIAQRLGISTLHVSAFGNGTEGNRQRSVLRRFGFESIGGEDNEMVLTFAPFVRRGEYR